MKTVRIVFSKTGRAKYVSHLDLVRTMTRAVRRAEIPLWYTEGFNRHPYLTFAAPLSLGFEGLAETMDLRLEEEMDYAVLVARLNAVMPEGLRVLSAAEAVAKAGDLAAAAYRLTLSCPPEVVQAALAAPELPVEKRTKKKTLKTVDVRPYFTEATVEAGESGTVMTVTLPCGSAETVNPSLFLAALNAFSGGEWQMSVLRTEIFAANGAVFR